MFQTSYQSKVQTIFERVILLNNETNIDINPGGVTIKAAEGVAMGPGFKAKRNRH